MIINYHKRSENQTFPIEIHSPNEEMFVPEKIKQNLTETRDWGQGAETDGTPGCEDLIGHPHPWNPQHITCWRKKRKRGRKSVNRQTHKDQGKCGQKMCVTWVKNFSLCRRQ